MKGRQLVGRITPPEIPVDQVRNVSTFYRPQVKPVVSDSMKQLANSLGGLVPTLRQYAQTQDQVEQVTQGEAALKLFNENKLAMGEAVKKGLIPEGASPYFIKKYVELDLKDKVNKFKEELFFQYGEQNVGNRTDQGAFDKFYNLTLENFKDTENLAGYNIVDLDAHFLNDIAGIKNNLQQQHINGRIGKMEEEGKLLLKKNGFNAINNVRNLTLGEIESEFDTSNIKTRDIKISYMAAQLQALADGAIDRNFNKQDVNNIVYDLVSQAAIENGDADILRVLDFIEMGDGGFMSQTSVGKDIIRKTKDEIISNENFDIRSYELRQTYLNNRKQEILDQGFLKLIDDKFGIQNVTTKDIKNYLSQEFTTENGEPLTIKPDDYTNMYRLYEGILAAETTPRNKASVVRAVEELIYTDPNNPEINQLIIDNMIDGNLTSQTAKSLIQDIPFAKESKKHPYLNSPEFDDLEQYIEDQVTQFRQRSRDEGVDIYTSRALTTKIRVFAKNLLFDAKYYGGQSPYTMSVIERQRAFTLTKELFDDLVEQQAFKLIGKLNPNLQAGIDKVNETLAQE